MTAADYLTGKHNEALNVICAEEAGWKESGIHSYGWYRGPSFHRATERIYGLPDYTADQNAARSLLAILSYEEWRKFHHAIIGITQCIHANPTENFKAQMLATALQISVAFAVGRGRVQ